MRRGRLLFAFVLILVLIPVSSGAWAQEVTPVPPTETPIPTITPVPPTDTPVPPTDTPIPPTDTPLPTDTSVPPTETPTETPTLEPSATLTETETPTLTETPSITPSLTETGTPTLPPSPTPLVFQVQAVQTYTVNSTADPGDGVCNVAECTLREAITAANANVGKDTIAFNIPGTGPHTIQPLSQLPKITDPVVIDGSTEPDFAGSPIVVIDGRLGGPGLVGIWITGGHSTVRGLVISGFVEPTVYLTGAGIRLETGGENIIEGNYIGTDVTGTITNPDRIPEILNGDEFVNNSGIIIEKSTNNLIGGGRLLPAISFQEVIGPGYSFMGQTRLGTPFKATI